MRTIEPDAFADRMDRINRRRELTPRESAALADAIIDGKVSHREAARLGLKRDMRLYHRREDA